MWELDCEESWVLKNWCFWTVVLEKTLESLLDCKEIQLVHPKGDQSWVFIGRTDAKAETPVLWPPHAKNWLMGKDSDAGRDWGQEKKGTTEDEMAGWHHRLDGCEFQVTSSVLAPCKHLECWIPFSLFIITYKNHFFLRMFHSFLSFQISEHLICGNSYKHEITYIVLNLRW